MPSWAFLVKTGLVARVNCSFWLDYGIIYHDEGEHLSYDKTQEHAQFVCQKEPQPSHQPAQRVPRQLLAKQLSAQDLPACFAPQAAIQAVV